jgi:hypothetical protein
MSHPGDEGGEAPCWAHLLEEEHEDADAEADAPDGPAGNAGGRAAVADG